MGGYRYPQPIRLSAKARQDLGKRIESLIAAKSRLEKRLEVHSKEAFGTVPERQRMADQSEKQAEIDGLTASIDAAHSVYCDRRIWVEHFDHPQSIQVGAFEPFDSYPTLTHFLYKNQVFESWDPDCPVEEFEEGCYRTRPDEVIAAGEGLEEEPSWGAEADASPTNCASARSSRAAIPTEVRREVWKRDQGQCARCGSRELLEYDHIVPVARGGSSTARNIELLCEACNRRKAARIE